MLSLFAGQELAVFGTVVRQLLGDAQQRIVFRAQVSSIHSCYRLVFMCFI